MTLLLSTDIFHNNKMAALFTICIISLMANIGYGLFDGSSSDYTVIPHSDISKQEEWIKLSDNRISVVGDLEFSSYTA